MNQAGANVCLARGVPGSAKRATTVPELSS